MISIVDSARFKVDRLMVKEFVSEYLRKRQIPIDTNLNVIFVGARKMLHIAKTYKHEEEALPVLSFPYITPKRMREEMADAGEFHKETQLLGEVFICYPQVVLLAAERNKKVDETLKDLLAHGINNLLKN